MRRRASCIAVLLAASAALHGCGTSGPTTTDGSRAITGAVTDAVSGQPIQAATAAVGDLGLSATSGEDGSYSLAGLPSQALQMQFSAAGYEPLTVTVDAAQTVVDAALSLAGTAVVTGRVTDHAGGGIGSARISVEGSSSATQTDASGGYNLYSVPSGLRTLTASAGGYHTQRRNLTLSSGGTVALNFVLDISPDTRSVRGQVTDAVTSVAIVGARVDVGGQTVLTDTEGLYLVTEVPGTSVVVNVTAEGYLQGIATVTLSGNDTVANFALISTETGGPPGPPG